MLYRLYQSIRAYKWAAVSFFVAWLLIAAYAATQLHFEEDITKVLPQNAKTTLTSKILKQLNFSDKISVVLTAKDSTLLNDMQEVAQALNDSLATTSFSRYIASVQGIIDEEDIDNTWQFVHAHLPLFLTDEDYHYLEQKLAADSVQAMVQSHYKTMLTPAGMVTQKYFRNDPFGLSFRGLAQLKKLNIDDNFTITDGYLTTTDRKHLLFFINPTYEGNDTEHNAAFVALLEQLQQQFNKEYSGKVKTYFFGAPFISVGNATQIKTDILTTVLISLSALYLLLVFFYRSVYIPFIAFIPSVFGVLTALSVLYVLKGSISAISISLGAVLLGVTIDYSLHILTHYKVSRDIGSLYRAVTVPILLSSITTAISFLCLLFVDSEIMRDLGVFAFVGIMVSALLSLVLVPHFYRSNNAVAVRTTFLDKVAAYPLHHNRWIVASCLLLIVLSFFFFNKVRFNGDIAAINYINNSYKEAQQQLEAITDSGYKSVYAAAYGNSFDEAAARNYELYQQLQQYKAQDSLKQFSSVGSVVLPLAEQQRRIDRWQSFWSAERKAQLRDNLVAYGRVLGFKEHTYEPFLEHLEVVPSTLHTLADYKALTAIPFEDFITEKDGFYTIANLIKVTDAQRSAFIRGVEAKGSAIAIDRKNLSETFLGKLKDDILLLVNYSSVAIFLILLLFFRRIELALLTLIPIAITGVVTSAIMSWAGIEFNVFSMIVCTLVLGHSVDFSIFMTCALQKDYTDGKNELPVYKLSVVLASITTFLAIGTLIFAKHPALKSIAGVSVIGIFTALVITFVFYPTIFGFFISNRPRKGLSPISLRLLLYSICSMLYYVVLSVVLSNIGRLLLLFTSKRTLWLRRCAAWLTTSVLYSNIFVRKRVENPHKVTLNEASVVIANHSSWLDTLAIGLFTYRISYMVNKWVYNSLVFGKYVRAMGFFPATEGIECVMPQVEANLKGGISVMIFPEGKRSESNQIHRFHQGAFYIAQQCHTPIVPIYIHGASEVQPKGDFVIYDGAITVVVGAPINPNAPEWGNTTREQAKRIGAYFREQFAALRKRLEGVDYLKEKLLLNYLYKDPAVVAAVKADYELHKEEYYQLSRSLPTKGAIVRQADDYGQVDFLLLITHPEREITTIIEDDYKRAVAEQSYITRIRKLRYLKYRTNGSDENDLKQLEN